MPVHSHWLFGYGSLIWRPDFPHLQRRRAVLPGWVRRFWQGSHDHRGVPEAPGRVVTLIAAPLAQCVGVAYQLEPSTFEAVIAALDAREQNGYARVRARLRIDDDRAAAADEIDGARAAANIDALTYIATPANDAFLGDAPLATLAAHIAAAAGPSGRNSEYLFELATALRALEADDEHVFELEAAVRALTCGAPCAMQSNEL